jgi:hypothetical protein
MYLYRALPASRLFSSPNNNLPALATLRKYHHTPQKYFHTTTANMSEFKVPSAFDPKDMQFRHLGPSGLKVRCAKEHALTSAGLDTYI